MGDTYKYKPILTSGLLQFIGDRRQVHVKREPPKAVKEGCISVKWVKASTANSRQLTCTGDKALHSRDQESPHKPKGEKTTVTIRKYQIQLQSYCKLCLLLFTTDLYSFHPPAQGLIMPPSRCRREAVQDRSWALHKAGVRILGPGELTALPSREKKHRVGRTQGEIFPL